MTSFNSSMPSFHAYLAARIPHLPVAGQDKLSLKTRQLIKELGKEKEDLDSPSLIGRESPQKAPKIEPVEFDEASEVSVPAVSFELEDLLSPTPTIEQEKVWLEFGLQKSGSTESTEESTDIENNRTPRNPFSSSSSSDSFSLTSSTQKVTLWSSTCIPNSFSSAFATPDHSPQKVSMNTPEALKNLDNIISTYLPGYDVSPKSKSILQKSMEKIDTKTSPVKNQLKSRIRNRFSEALEKTGSTSEVPSPQAKRRLFSCENVNDIRGQWTIDIANFVDSFFVDTSHITDLEGTGGFHICPEGHPLDSFVKFRRINLKTAVWCGKVFDPQNPQQLKKTFSSFIPRNMTAEQYKMYIAESLCDDTRKIAQQDNRALYEIVDEQNKFFIECYFQLGGRLIRSPFPLFHYEVYQGHEKSFTLRYSTQDSLESPPIEQVFEVFYEKLFELIKTTPLAEMYDTEKLLIIDVGILYQANGLECPINKGLYVEIPKKFLL